MTHEEKKLAKIVEELTIFFFALGAEHFCSEIEKSDGKAAITITSDYSPQFSDKLTGLDQYLNGQKNDGMEDIYWELAGSGDPGETNQLLLVGMMIDHAEISVSEKEVSLKLYKKMLG